MSLTWPQERLPLQTFYVISKQGNNTGLKEIFQNTALHLYPII
jgi:hypothetical protein